MGDEELRTLERAAREKPDDGEAGWAYARALGRNGDRQGEFLELCRLAQVDARALGQLRGWAPWPSANGIGGATRAGAADAARRPLDVRRLSPKEPGQRPVAISSRVALFLSPSALVARGVVDLSPRWRLAVSGLSAGNVGLVGGNVLLAIGSDLVLLDESSGSELAKASFPGEQLGALLVEADRAFLRFTGPGWTRLGVVDVGRSFGRRLWAKPLELRAEAMLAGRHVVFEPSVTPRQFSVVALEDGTAAWELSEAVLALGAARLLAADERGVVFGARGDDGRQRLVELDVRDGTERWRARLDTISLLRDERALAPGAFVVATEPRNGPRRLVAVERSAGTTRPVRELPPGRHSIAVVDDRVLIGSLVGDEKAQQLRIAGLQLGSAKPFLDTELARDLAGVHVEVAPIERGVLIYGHASPNDVIFRLRDAGVPEAKRPTTKRRRAPTHRGGARPKTGKK